MGPQTQDPPDPTRPALAAGRAASKMDRMRGHSRSPRAGASLELRQRPDEGSARAAYARLASRYDRRWGTYVRATAEATLRRADLAGRRLLLDVGCGTGAFLRRAIGSEPHLAAVGVDVTPEMLQIASSTLGPKARLAASDVHALPFRGGTFDVVTSLSSFHFWECPDLALAEIGRVMAPGAELVLTDWCDDVLACRICDRLVDSAHHQAYRSEACRAMLEDAGLQVRSVSRFRGGWLWGLMTARARKATR